MTGPPPVGRRSGRRVLGAVLLCIGLPAALALAEAVSFRARNRNNGALVSSGEKREYLLHVPRSYGRARPAPLVISLHAAALWPAAQMETSRWNQLADEEGFLVVYPKGSGTPSIFRAFEGPGLVRDVRFIADLIDALEAAYDIDPARIYANGLSNGGGMSFALSCALSDRIAAVGMVGAAQTLPWSSCTDPRPVPMIAFHGTADTFTPYRGGNSPVAGNRLFPNILTFTASWARRNRCGSSPAQSRVAKDVTRLEYPECEGDAAVVLYTIEGGGHTWPGGGPLPEWMVGPTSNGIDATREMWAFFREHPLPGPSLNRHNPSR